MQVTLTSLSSEVMKEDDFYRGFLHDFGQVSSFFAFDHRSPGAGLRRKEHISSDFRADRRDVAEWLLERNTEWGALPPALEAAERMKSRAASAVLAQVRPGLLGGDYSVLRKVLSAIEYARRLSEVCEAPVIPVVWVISEHNWGAMGRVRILDDIGQLHRLALYPDPPPATPAGDIPLHPGISDVLGRMERALRINSPADNPVCDLLRRTAREADTLDEFFCRFLVGLFSGSGVLVVNENEAETRRRIVPVLQRAAVARYSVEQELEVGREQLEMAGYTAPLRQGRGHCHFLADTQRGRRRLIRSEEVFRDEHDTFNLPVDSVTELMLEQPHLFSPAEVLRPIAQNEVLPVMAHVAGPAEAAIHAQSKGVWSIFSSRTPPIYPQLHLTFTGPEVSAALSRAGLTVADAARAGEGERVIEAQRRRVLDDLGADSVREAFDAAEGEMNGILQGLWRRLQREIPSAEAVHHCSEEHMSNLLGRYRRKGLQHFRRRHRETVRDFRLIRNALHPDGGEQAHLSYLPELMRSGGEWIIATCRALSKRERLWSPFAVRWDDGE